MRTKKLILSVVCVTIFSMAPSACSGGNAVPASSTSTLHYRTISGRISYSGTVLPFHQIIIVAIRVGEQAPAFSTVVSGPGNYIINNVGDSSYTIFAFMELGNDMGSPQPNEPSGYYDQNGDGKGDEVVMKDGEGIGNINITLSDPK